MGQGYTGGMGSSGGKNYWYNAMQSLQPYRSGYRPEESKITESGVMGKSRRLDQDTKALIDNLNLQSLERKYEQEDLDQQTRIQKRAVDRQKQGNMGTAAMTAAKVLGTKAGTSVLGNLAISAGLGTAGTAIATLAPPALLALGAIKWAQGAGLIDRNLFRPRKWRF